MLKRTFGRLLLILVVITGLAGTVNESSITKKERKAAINLLKDSREDLMRSIKGLSEAQLNFKATKDHWSIKECMYHIAISEKNIWGMLEGTMKAPANPEKRSEIKVTDEQLIKMIEDRSNKRKTIESFEPKNTPYQSMNEALESYKNMRADHIKYIRSTTEDMHNHITQLPFGMIDCYQVCLFMAAHNNRHTQQINEIKADPGFPKQ
jgi:DinB superfamily